MVDFTKCQNYACPRNLECYRFTAMAGHFQSYQKFEFEVIKDVFKCNFFIKQTKK